MATSFAELAAEHDSTGRQPAAAAEVYGESVCGVIPPSTVTVPVASVVKCVYT
ncbi:MAG TPA: hypothetical protein VGM44_10385 [Polyangiaceae bacterium]